LIGADAEHLPAHSADLLFFSAAVRADLGLRGPREFAREQGEALAALLIRVPQVMATWRSQDADEPRALAPWLARLRAVCVALGRDPLRAADAAAWSVAPVPVRCPGPSAPARLPPRISASQYQSLVNCAYQFYARCLLGLRPLDEVTEDPDQRDYGEAVHAVLARFHREWGDAALHEVPRPQLDASLAAHTAAVFDAKVDKLPRFLAMRQQFVQTQSAYLDWAQSRAAEGWRFVAAEAAQSVTIEYAAAGGTRTVELIGRIDRIDARGEAKELLDYKTRRRSALTEGLKRAGEDVQLPFYGLLLAPQASSAAYVAIQPPKLRSRERESGVDVVRPAQDYAELVAGVQARLRDDLQRVAAGAALTALGVESACRYCEMRGLCRRDYWQEEAG
ncbi:MAG TPA: PD-(D/E)XK nuclease family protein, partial [Burkholderiaceae bacterium]|nr:PD-(D/E)XK nuclease family protein [Burkholderiaceae bacterium]